MYLFHYIIMIITIFCYKMGLTRYLSYKYIYVWEWCCRSNLTVSSWLKWSSILGRWCISHLCLDVIVKELFYQAWTHSLLFTGKYAATWGVMLKWGRGTGVLILQTKDQHQQLRRSWPNWGWQWCELCHMGLSC